MPDYSDLVPANLKPGLTTPDGENLKPSLVTPSYAGGTPAAAGDIKPSLRDAAGNLKPGLVHGANLKSSLLSGAIAAAQRYYLFDGSNDEVTLPASLQTFITKSAAYTVAAWIRPPSGAWSLINVASAAADRHGINGGSGNIQAGLFNGTAYVGQRLDAGYTAGQWVHIAYTHSAGTVVLYVNGVANNSGTVIGNLGTNTSLGLTNNGTWRLTGGLFDVRLFASALDAAAVAALHNNSSGLTPKSWYKCTDTEAVTVPDSGSDASDGTKVSIDPTFNAVTNDGPLSPPLT